MAKISKIAIPGVAEPYDIGTLSIPFGQVDSTSTDTAYTAQIEGITSLYDGVCVYLKNGVITSNKNGFTLNINGLGAKPVYDTLAAATRSGTVFNVDYTMLFVYNSSRVSGGCWDIFYGYNSDTTDLEEALTPLTGTTGTLTPMQVYNAIKSGKSVVLQYMDNTYGLLSYTNFNVAESMNVIAADTIVYFNNTYVLAELWGDTTRNVWGFQTTTLAQKEHSHSASDVKVTVTIGETQMDVLLSNYLADTILPMIQSRLLLSGGTMTGSINMGANSITNLAAPTNDADAATKKYVDSALGAYITDIDTLIGGDS